VDKTGARLSKGFGFGARGAPVVTPTFTIAHALMVVERLEEMDSRVIAFGTPQGLHHVLEPVRLESGNAGLGGGA
jgi:5-formyltetrahydrofolate cyclo-ligase